MIKFYNTMKKKNAPWITNWFDLNENILLKLRGNLLEKIIINAIKKSGNAFRLSKITGIKHPNIYNILYGKINMISVKKLKKILRYIKIDYKNYNNKIEFTKKGSKISIKNPKFPFNLKCVEGAEILGNMVSDGSIYLDKKSRNTLRTVYYTSEKEDIERFKSNISKVYGEVFFQERYERNCFMIKIGSSIIGETLIKVGAILGNKTEVNGNIPWMVKQGSTEFKKAYLRSIFSDEGSLYAKRGGFITISRYVHIHPSKRQIRQLESLKESMISNKFPTGHINKSIGIKKANSIIKDVDIKSLLDSKPNLLTDEQNLLNDLNIESKIWNRSLTKTTLGKYSICSTLHINKRESVNNFNKHIGFMTSEKQIKLGELIKNGWKT